MTDEQMKKGAAQFAKEWAFANYERGQAQPFWIALLRMVFGIDNPEKYIKFEEKIKASTTHYADGFIDNTCVLIEHKSANVNLAKTDKKGNIVFNQAKEYDNSLKWSKHARWIITCNFRQFFIYDMDKEGFPHKEFNLKDLQDHYRELKILIEAPDEIDSTDEKEKLIANKASEFVRKMYSEIKRHNKVDKPFLHSLNVFCVRVVFCLYADDSHLFDNRQFRTFIKHYSAEQLQEKFDHLFFALNTKEDERPSVLDAIINKFPHVNGGLFADDKTYTTPIIPRSVKEMLLNEAENLGIPDSDEKFTWDKISPTNFGCIFESTVDDVVRKSGGMHYTTAENIHKVIKPLFLDDLTEELNEILSMPDGTKEERKSQDDALEAYRTKLSSFRFLDPACGSGNFLTETFKSLRELEMKALNRMVFLEKERYFENMDPCKVQITQFYGIEIDDFAANVARTALWISKCQMQNELKKIIKDVPILPLEKNEKIICDDALKCDWTKLVRRDRKHPVFVIGNPPFQGSQRKDKEQKESKAFAMSQEHKGKKIWEKHGSLDFACAWYAKAAEFMQGHNNIEVAFVSTNSITQGEQVALLWEPLIKHYNLCITFAWKSFKWFNKADSMAQVHCIIVGLGKVSRHKGKKRKLFQIDGKPKLVNHINCYLMDAEDFFIKSRSNALGNVPEMVKGSIPVDGGHLIIDEDDYEDFINKEPDSIPFIKLCLGAKEYLHSLKRYCLWIPDNTPSSLLKSLPLVYKRIKATEEMRHKSPKKATQAFADRGYRFMEIRQPKTDYILVPSHSSEKRKYIPIGIVSSNIISSNANLIIPEPSKWLFAILLSKIHMAWVKYTCGRIKSDYRYSADVVYNNFPWMDLTEEQRAALSNSADRILEARKLEGCSTLADMYDFLKGELREAHLANDKLVTTIYGINDKNDEDIALELMRRSVKMATISNRTKRKKARI